MTKARSSNWVPYGTALPELQEGPNVKKLGLEQDFEDLRVLLPSSGRSWIFRGRLANAEEVVIKLLPKRDEFYSDSFCKQLALVRGGAGHHRNIARMQSFGWMKGYFMVETDYCEGDSVDSIIGQLSLRQALQVFVQVSEAMRHAHKYKLFHWNLKPADILVDASNTVHVLDFGTPRPWSSDQIVSQPADQLESLLGDLSYIAPETRRFEDVDARANIYSLGCIMHVCLAACGSVPDELNEFVLQCMSDEPSQRPSGMSQLSRELEWWLQKQPADTCGSTG